MSKSKVLVLGGSGMLGSMVADVLSRDDELSVVATVRQSEFADIMNGRVKNIDWRILEAGDEGKTAEQLKQFEDIEWVVNAIGIIKPYAHDDKPDEVQCAIKVNAAFPHQLGRCLSNARILQIATDCVYSGTKGEYIETDKHDALDVYGKTKSLGEVGLANVSHLRCSIIGPEPKSYVSLIEWFRRQPKDANISGFTNHLWNGVTTLHFGKLCLGIIKNNLALTGCRHVIPGNCITKYELLCFFGKAFKREDIEISPSEAPTAIDRTLLTDNEEMNQKLWSAAGYEEPPTVEAMVEELAQFDYRFEDLY